MIVFVVVTKRRRLQMLVCGCRWCRLGEVVGGKVRERRDAKEATMGEGDGRKGTRWRRGGEIEEK